MDTGVFLWAIVNHTTMDVHVVLCGVCFSSGAAGSHGHAPFSFVGNLSPDVQSLSAQHTYESFFSVEARVEVIPKAQLRPMLPVPEPGVGS